jgi:hypothetical protein
MEVSGQPHTLTLTLEKVPWVPMNRSLGGGPQSQYGCVGAEKNLLSLQRFESQIVQPVTYSLYQLHYLGSVGVILPVSWLPFDFFGQ